MTLRVLDPGLYTLVVDFGRPHSRSLGVPLGGAADRASLMLGNALLGNPPDAPALEMSLAGPTLEAGCELACVVYGAPFTLQSDRQPLRPGKTFTLSPGEQLHLGGALSGVRAYLCVLGGLQTPLVLGSRSSLAPLQAGTELICIPGRTLPRFAEINLEPEPGTPLRIVPGAQAGWFARDDFEDREFEVSPASNRMGLRLRGQPLPVPEREMVSEPVCPGAVQATRDGQCIILGVDGQTIGGYPKIAQVISADLDRLGQLRPGERIRFQRVSLTEAETLYRARQTALREWVTRLQLSAAR
jgi:antagonist of KipI